MPVHIPCDKRAEDRERDQREHYVKNVMREIQVQLIQKEVAGFANCRECDQHKRDANGTIRGELSQLVRRGSGYGLAGHRWLCLAVGALRGEPGEQRRRGGQNVDDVV